MNYTQREKLVDRICGAVLMLICFEIYCQIVHSSYTEFNYNLANVTKWIYIVGGIILAIAVFLLVYSYLKKDGNKGLYGVELLALSMISATLPGTYLDYPAPFNKLNKIYPFIILIYYIFKIAYIVYDVKKVNNAPKKSKKKAKKKR